MDRNTGSCAAALSGESLKPEKRSSEKISQGRFISIARRIDLFTMAREASLQDAEMAASLEYYATHTSGYTGRPDVECG